MSTFISNMQKARDVLAFTALFLATIVLASYLFNLAAFYRPFIGEPSAHPLSVISAALLGLIILVWRQPLAVRVKAPCLILVLLVCTTALLDTSFSQSIQHWLTPFKHIIVSDNELGYQNVFSLNSAAMLMFIALALILSDKQRPRLSQVAALLALTLPTLSLIDYAFAQQTLFAQMSITTTTVGFFLALSTATLHANQGLLRRFFSAQTVRTGMNWHLTCRMAVLMGFSYLLFKSIMNNQADNLFGVYVVGICWTLILLTAVTVLVQESLSVKDKPSSRALHNDDLIDQSKPK